MHISQLRPALYDRCPHAFPHECLPYFSQPTTILRYILRARDELSTNPTHLDPLMNGCIIRACPVAFDWP